MKHRIVLMNSLYSIETKAYQIDLSKQTSVPVASLDGRASSSGVVKDWATEILNILENCFS